jgi:hypothetical protein
MQRIRWVLLPGAAVALRIAAAALGSEMSSRAHGAALQSIESKRQGRGPRPSRAELPKLKRMSRTYA